jgi:hypothetical protein
MAWYSGYLGHCFLYLAHFNSIGAVRFAVIVVYICKVSYRHQSKEDSSDAEYKLKIILERNDSVNVNLHITSNCETTMK